MSRRAAAMSRPKSRSDSVERRCIRESGGVRDVSSDAIDGTSSTMLDDERADKGRIHSLKNAAADLVV
jgi:hypothetical protein